MPKLDGKEYEYTEKGIEQYEKDKKRFRDYQPEGILTEKAPLLDKFLSFIPDPYQIANYMLDKKGSPSLDEMNDFLTEEEMRVSKGLRQIEAELDVQRKEIRDAIRKKGSPLTDEELESIRGRGSIDKDREDTYRYLLADPDRVGKSQGGSIKSIISNLLPSLYGKNTKVEKKGNLDFGYNPSFLYQPRVKKQEGGEVDAQMEDMLLEEKLPTEETMPEMIPDEQMEDNYTDFIIGESLTPEDEEYLLTALEQDDRLSMIFDRVVETASEFSGSGPVEGPGTEMSDSIPARLSDGEFVMTSKAANQIGPDNLQGLMEVAEMEADNAGRQMKQAGGYVEEAQEEQQEEQEIDQAIQPKERQGRLLPRSLADKKVNESMIALNPRNSLFAR